MLIEIAGTTYNIRGQQILIVFLFKYATTYVKHNNCVVSVTQQQSGTPFPNLLKPVKIDLR